MAAAEEVKKIQIYSSSSSSSSGRLVTPFWKEKYERDAKKYWDVFYRRHQDKFFKDRHYLDKEWGRYFQVREREKLVVLEVGCGAGNTIFPLVSTYPDIFVHACDFSPRAVDLVKHHKDFSADQINAFVCDLTVDNLSEIIEPSSVDIVTMVFVLSAVAPEKMPLVVQNIRKILKKNGCVLFRDYASGDLAQERLIFKEQQLSENFYVRGDGTRAYYFSEDFLTNLFAKDGFDVKEICIHNKQVENRSLELVMNRCWIQATFTINSIGLQQSVDKLNLVYQECSEHNPPTDISLKDYNDTEIDLSEDIGYMFGTPQMVDETIEITVKAYNFRIKALAKEYQHTCKSTGLILWESAHLMCNVLAENPSIVSGKRVLELGCGSAGVCSMVAANFAQLVIATDGDTEALDLLRQNISSNLEACLINKIAIKRLRWGNKEDMKAIEDLCSHEGGFEVIIGTDVVYNPDSVFPFFETAKELISSPDNGESKVALIMCHIQRRVDEGSMIATAELLGFRLVDKWTHGMNSSGGIISTWFSSNDNWGSSVPNAPLTILYFQV
ncbi:uncharacterized protein [Typha latifolia]|uniref:uncharacterized protein n=1 Tax=Typha latifolia TaxID=4733 RepID=UPI003C2EEDA6